MKVKDIMTGAPACCGPYDTLDEVATLMWDHDCGAIPVLDENQRAIGLITDRDICMAVVTRGWLPHDLRVEQVISREVYVCHPEDSVAAALETMREKRVRRLPVAEQDGRIAGILSINDVVLAAGKPNGKSRELGYTEVLDTLKAISAHPRHLPAKDEDKLEAALPAGKRGKARH